MVVVFTAQAWLVVLQLRKAQISKLRRMHLLYIFAAPKPRDERPNGKITYSVTFLAFLGYTIAISSTIYILCKVSSPKQVHYIFCLIVILDIPLDIFKFSKLCIFSDCRMEVQELVANCFYSG